jgi:hypothetical protein
MGDRAGVEKGLEGPLPDGEDGEVAVLLFTRENALWGFPRKL